MKALRYVCMTVLILALMLSFAACGGSPGGDADTEGAGQVSTEAADTVLPAGFDLSGDWVDDASKRARMTITGGEGDDGYGVEIVWANSATEGTVWTFSGKFDTSAGFLYYQDGRKAVVTAAEDAVTGGETIMYEGGTGKIVYDDGALLWEDDKENAGAECHFVKPAEKEE